MSALAETLPASPESIFDPELDAARTTVIDGLLTRGFPLMQFPPDLEREFQQAGLEARRAHILKSGFISLLVFNVFLVADYLMLPDVFALALVLRLLVFTPLALLFLWGFAEGGRIPLFRHVSPARLELIAMGSGLTAAALLIFIQCLSHSPLAYLYHIGFMVVITYGNIVQRLRFWYAVAFSLTLLALHVVGIYALPSFPDRMVLPLVSMVLSSAAFTLSANYALENDDRRRFLLTERERGLIRSLTQTQVRLRELSRVDDLTGLYNRRHFESAVQQLWQRASFGRTPLAIFMIDVDHFKMFNDHYGHPAGDACLKEVCQEFRQTLNGQGVIVARYGGEEFIAAIPNLDEAATLALAEQVRAQVERCQIPHARSTTSSVVTASLGVAWCEARPGMKVEHLMSLADGALYDAKHQGRNRVCSQST
jgi:diguanylate cyclase (GGDEF)-like protein